VENGYLIVYKLIELAIMSVRSQECRRSPGRAWIIGIDVSKSTLDSEVPPEIQTARQVDWMPDFVNRIAHTHDDQHD
jgi:hypothetical protein